jgi:hypothetical protein
MRISSDAQVLRRPEARPTEAIVGFAVTGVIGSLGTLCGRRVAEALKRREAIYARLDCPPLIRAISWWIGSRPVIPIM